MEPTTASRRSQISDGSVAASKSHGPPSVFGQKSSAFLQLILEAELVRRAELNLKAEYDRNAQLGA